MLIKQEVESESGEETGADVRLAKPIQQVSESADVGI
jgi:hypothetical protein